MNTDIDTSDLLRVERIPISGGPALDTPAKSPFYISPLPSTSVVNPDAVRNFQNTTIPSFRITPPLPLTLSGAASNTIASVRTASLSAPQPPAPIVSVPLASIPTGYQFTFLQVKLPANAATGAAISTYRVYRNTANTTGGATVVHVFVHNPANGNDPVIFQDSQPNATTQFYWVSAVNASGVESTLTPAQSGAVTNLAGFNVNSRLAGTFNGLPSNTTWSPLSTTTLSNNGLTSTVSIAANTNQVGPNLVSYSSGSAAVGSFVNSVIYYDDPLYQGGAVIYQFNTAALGVNLQAASDNRFLIGKISTTVSSSTTGGGTSGGTTGPGGAGGRGLIEF